MNTTFPRILTLLRKERGVSQKQTAADLQISQALLSHYEKGIRECGLDFVVKVAAYYNVSCDYLLGRTAEKSGAVISVEEIPEGELGKEGNIRGSVLPVLNKKLVQNSVNVVFDLLQRCNCKGLTTEVSAYLSLAVYNVFRMLYTANGKNPDALFSVPPYLFQPAMMGEMSKTTARIGQLCAGHAVDGEPGLEPGAAPSIVPDAVFEQYPQFASSLFNLLRNAEIKLVGN